MMMSEKRKVLLCLYVLASVHACVGDPVRYQYGESLPSPKEGRVTLSDRLLCGDGDTQPANRVDTVARNEELISILEDEGYSGYIIPTGDDHQSEYVPPTYKRRTYISGFSGSAGTAVVLTNGSRALWTDGRYFLQADEELDCNWLFMKTGQTGVPSIEEFIVANLAAGSKVSADAKTLGYGLWLQYEAALNAAGIELVPSTSNLIDPVWDNDVENERPAFSNINATVHDIIYAGLNVSEKISNVRADLVTSAVDGLFLTTLDEIAWLFNIRGWDVPYNPVLQSYAYINSTVAKLYTDLAKLPDDVMSHLNLHNVIVEVYESALTDLQEFSTSSKIMLPDDSLTPGCSYQVYQTVPEANRVMDVPPPLLMKAEKNPTELEQMKLTHVRDAVALCDFLAFMEKEIAQGNAWSELSAQEQLDAKRAEQVDFQDLSFEDISAYGPHASVIHYSTSALTDVPILNDSLYLLDTGGQYLGGTTDVTRTVHFGTPTSDMIDMYTRVLMGSIDFGSLIFPYGTTYQEADILARRPIYEKGLDYRHGTSHGIGMYLNVHEPKPSVYKPGYVMSDEPGYYQDNEWGIRIENQMFVVETNLEFDYPYYTFEFMTLVPFEPKLINVELLTDNQIDWLNAYYQKIRDVLGPELIAQGKTEAYDWMFSKTWPV